ncbi:uncharacterized protein E0L32_006606 [Thyridium curvatum]|uniref:ASST-domain-containing protein n=1 Tax=Thyridium curvatum TaxID=1093900 RepID=A0A507B7C3_9PEZI|nr:uncharacterized protein E0L32_006606 [Thyridium curvatum]TPX12961.1 hypothetical protein E0L32_006606 [Thyridium curvatum]
MVAPLFQVTTWDKTAVDRAPYIFMSTLAAIGDSPPATYIFQSSDLSLVYAEPAAADGSVGSTTANVRTQKLNDETYLTYWRGPNVGGNSSRGCGFYNQQYELVYDVNPVGLAPEVVLDIHECQVTQDNTVLISIYAARPIDARPVGGPADGLLIDSLFQEIDPVTNELLFTWAAIDHFVITDSHVPYEVITTSGATGWDWSHLNSVEKTADGNYLVSFRHLSTVSLHNGTTGATIWALGGKANQFADLSGGNATNFAWQHDARFRSADLRLLSLFDNQGDNNQIGCTGVSCSRGLLLDLDFEAVTARVEREYRYPIGLVSDAMGSYGVLDNGNVLVGWGLNPAITEYHSDTGECVFDVQFAPWPANENDFTNANYRVFKGDWMAYPAWPPAAVVEDGVLYVSWNGATEVSHWAIYTAADGELSDSLQLDLVAPKDGFETSIAVKKKTRYVQAKALNRDRQAIPGGSSAVIEL